MLAWWEETQVCSTACNPLCILGALGFDGNLKSEELCVLIGMFFPHVALFSHDIPCFQTKVLQAQSLQIFPNTFAGAAEEMPHSCYRYVSGHVINSKESLLSADTSSTIRIALSRAMLKEIQIG